ncbi:MAG: hypothetical protein HY904_15350 [Deltaproteobacteria bacterium]|nr:hypothetical protein [Deltaproteobacteria bacterium]
MTARTFAALLGVAALCQGCFAGSPYDVERHRITRDNHAAFPVRDAPHAVDCNSCHVNPETFTDFSCVGCHEHGQDRADPAHVGVSGYSWGPTTCYACHPDGKASISREGHERYFPIFTGNHAAVACGDCHTGSARTEFNCIDCHSHTCATVDRRHVMVDSYQCASPDCLRCHPAGTTRMSRSEHSPYFPVSRGRHALACMECHDSAYSTYYCVECHTGEHTCARMSFHYGETGNYTCATPRCYACHPRGTED